MHKKTYNTGGEDLVPSRQNMNAAKMRQLARLGLVALMLTPLAGAWAEGPAKPMPTHVCSPRMGDYSDRQGFIGFNDGSVQWCMSRNQCIRLEGLPETPSPIVAFSCEREQFVWVIRADGQAYRCMGALGRKGCDRVALQP